MGGVAVLLISVWQLGILAKVSGSPLPSPQEQHSCNIITGDLRTFALSAIIAEFLALSTASGAIGDGSGWKELGAFCLRQAAIFLVLVRTYCVWLSLGLHALRSELMLAVLPHVPKEDLGPSERRLTSHRLRELDAMVPAWGAEDSESGDPAVQVARKMQKQHARNSAILITIVAIIAVLVASRSVLRRAGSTASEPVSSCRAGMWGVDFCVPVEYIGQSREVASWKDCCSVCDTLSSCHAWSFTAAAATRGTPAGSGRCWWLHFPEAPCRDNPGHPGCRCRTSADRIGGFRPSPGDRLWVGSV